LVESCRAMFSSAKHRPETDRDKNFRRGFCVREADRPANPGRSQFASTATLDLRDFCR
jgi:hypothetical protein